MFKTVVGFLSGHAAQAVGAASGLMLAGMVGYVAFSGSFGVDFFDEMAWERNAYDTTQMFGAVSYKVGEVDESDNRIHEDEGEDEGVSNEPIMSPEDDARSSEQMATVISDTVATDAGTLVGDDTVVVDDPSNPNASIVPGGSGGGEGPGGGSGPGGAGGGELPPPSEAQQEQLAPYPPHVNENGNTLEYIKADVPVNWTFARGDSYSPDGVKVWATFSSPDGSLMDPVEVPYGGDDGYEAYLSKAWGSGTHEATFVYKGKSAHATYEVMGKRYKVAYGSWSDEKWFSVDFPGQYLDDDDLEKAAKSIQDNAVPENLVGGYYTDCTDALRFMITVLGREDVYNNFKNSGKNDYAKVRFLEPFDSPPDTDLEMMAVGFAPMDDTENPCVYLPSEEGGLSATAAAALLVEEVPAGFHVRRVEGAQDQAYLGNQVLVGYDGDEAKVEVPLGVTRVALTQPNEKVTHLYLSESVLDIDYASLTKSFPNLEHIQVGDNNNQSFSSYAGVLYGADGRRVLYVPPQHKPMGAGYDAWSPYAEVIEDGAFTGCKTTHVTIPTQIAELEAGCLAGSAIGTLEFASEEPIAGMANSGFAGDFYVPDTPYDTACKQWTAAVGGSDGMRVGVLGAEGAFGQDAAVRPGAYEYDAERDVVVSATEPTVLMGVPASAPKAYLVPDGIEAIGAGAFAATTGMREIVMPESVRELRADSLVGLGDGASVTLLGSEVVAIDAAVFGDVDGSGGGASASAPDMTVFVPGELLERYRTSWGSVLGEDVAQKLLKPTDATYLYLDNAKYLPLDGASTKLRLLEVFDEGQTFFEPDLRTIEIADAAFLGCASLEIVHIPASVASVGDGAFEGCASLESVVASGKLSALPDVGTAQLLQSGDSVSYDYESDTGAVYRTDKNGELTLVNVPTDAESITVRANTAHLGDAAFASCTHFNPTAENVTLATPETLRSVGAHCFEGGAGLGSLYFLERCTALESIGERAFADHADLESAFLPDVTTVVGEGAFSGCKELIYAKAEGLNEFAPRMFANCTLLRNIRAANVSVIGDESFYGCERLMTIADGLDVDKITWVGDRAFAYCVSFMQDASTTLNMKSLTHIGAQAFRDCQTLRTVVLPETLTEMGEEAFRDCTALFTLNANSSLSIIGRYSFYGCTNMSNVNLGDRQKQALTTIGACAFVSCNVLERLDLSDCASLAYLGDRAFGDCAQLLRVTLPASLTKVSDRCFEGCPYFSILELTAAKPTELGFSVFGASPPEYVRIWVPDEQACATYLDAYEQKLDPEYGDGYALSVLEVRSDTSETLRGITYTATDDGHWIVTDAMENLSGDVTLTSDVVAIAPRAFEGCDELKNVQYELGATISLGDRAFAGCESLETAMLYGGIPEWGESVFEGCPNLKRVYLGLASTGSSISRIGPRAFADCTSLERTTFALPIEKIEDEAFMDCTSLSIMGFSDPKDEEGQTINKVRSAIKSYGDRAFMNCTSLRTPPLHSKYYTALESIGEQAFANCDTITSATIPASVTSVGEACFAECDKISTVSFYAALEEYPKDCFKNCVSLTRTGGTGAAVGALKRIGEGAYAGCTSLTANKNWTPGKYTALESIGDGAFAGAFKHAEAPYSFTLASSLAHIGANAFDGCVGLASVELQSAPTLDANAFANMAEGFKLKVPDGTYDAYLPVLAASIGEEAARSMLFDEAAAAAAAAAASEAASVAGEAAEDAAAARAATSGAADAASTTSESAAAANAEGAAGGSADGSDAGKPAAAGNADKSDSPSEPSGAAAADDAAAAGAAAAADGAGPSHGAAVPAAASAADDAGRAPEGAEASSSATRSTEPTEGETA